jgi:hypothetical protein
MGPAKRGTVLRMPSGLAVSTHAANVVRFLRIIGVSGWLRSCRDFSCGPSPADRLAWRALVATFVVWVGLARLTRRAGQGQ